MNEQVHNIMDNAADSFNTFVENLNQLENSGWLQDQDMNEIGYYLRRVIDIVGMDIDIDQYNDDALTCAAE